MEELKREQEAREKRTADREQRRSDRKSQSAGMLDLSPYQADEVLDDDKLPGSFDDVDPQTTNLYVGNLAPQVYSQLTDMCSTFNFFYATPHSVCMRSSRLLYSDI
jgi:hypothetical protein